MKWWYHNPVASECNSLLSPYTFVGRPGWTRELDRVEGLIWYKAVLDVHMLTYNLGSFFLLMQCEGFVTFLVYMLSLAIRRENAGFFSLFFSPQNGKQYKGYMVS